MRHLLDDLRRAIGVWSRPRHVMIPRDVFWNPVDEFLELDLAASWHDNTDVLGSRA
jgi:hypothetical protein